MVKCSGGTARFESIMKVAYMRQLIQFSDWRYSVRIGRDQRILVSKSDIELILVGDPRVPDP